MPNLVWNQVTKEKITMQMWTKNPTTAHKINFTKSTSDLNVQNYISIIHNINNESFTTCTYNDDEECLWSAEEVKIKCRQLVFWPFCFSYFSYLFSGRKNCHPWRLCITGKIKENLGFPFFFFLIFLSRTFLDICITRKKISPESKVPLQEKWPWGNIDGPR